MSSPKPENLLHTVSRPELLIDGSDECFRELVHASLAFSSRLQAIRDGYGELLDLTGPQYTLLISISYLQKHGRVGVTKVAKHLSLSGTFVTTEINKLVKAGLVCKEKSETDGRRVILTTTEKANAKLATLREIQQQVNDVHFGSLSREEFQVLLKIMPELVASTDHALTLLAHLSATRR